jgi:hypothetical protein
MILSSHPKKLNLKLFIGKKKLKYNNYNFLKYNMINHGF